MAMSIGLMIFGVLYVLEPVLLPYVVWISYKKSGREKWIGMYFLPAILIALFFLTINLITKFGGDGSGAILFIPHFIYHIFFLIIYYPLLISYTIIKYLRSTK